MPLPRYLILNFDNGKFHLSFSIGIAFCVYIVYINELNIYKQELYCVKFYICSSFVWDNVTLWNEQFNLPYFKYSDAA